MIGQRLYAWSVKFEQFAWGLTIGVVFLLFAAGPALQRLVVAQRHTDINVATLQLIGGAALVAYGFGFLWSMVGHMLWEVILAKELDQYSTLNGYLGAMRSWTRTGLMSALTAGLIVVTALDPFSVVRDMETALKDFATNAVAEVSSQVSMQVSNEIATETQRAMNEVAQQVAKGGTPDPTALKPNLDQGLGRMGAGIEQIIKRQAERSIKRAEQAIQTRYEENLVVLTWLPPWGILLLYLLGHAWVPFSLLLIAPWDRISWRWLLGLGRPRLRPQTGSRARTVIDAYATRKPDPGATPALPGSTARPGSVDAEWREVDGDVEDDGRAA